MPRLFGACLFLVSAPLAVAQNAPIAGRPVDYSNIEGKYEIRISAHPVQVHVEELITLRVEIIGSGPKEFEPDRKYLKLFPESFERDFYKDEARNEHGVDRDKKTWTFVYRIKPKHIKVDAIDGIKLAFYDPGASRFVTKYAKRIDLTVTPKPDDSGNFELTDVQSAPEVFYRHVAGKDSLQHMRTYAIPAVWQLVLLIAAPPFLCFAVALVWRKIFPDSSLVAAQHRLAAAARALESLKSGPGTPRDIVQQYLRDRLGYAVEQSTPADVFAFLSRRGISLAICRDAQAFFKVDEAGRYSQSDLQPSPTLAQGAAQIIQALEVDPCASV